MRQVPILLYHWFETEESPPGSRSPQLSIRPEAFRGHLQYLKRRGYETVSLVRALDGRDLPPRPIVISFDDGTADFWRHARPALAEHAFTATLFVVTGYVGGESSWDAALGEPARPLMRWDQIAELHRTGHEIGSHTHEHRVLTELSDDEALRQLATSRDELTLRLGQAPELLAYPRGFYEPRHKRLAEEAGFSAACAVTLKLADVWRSDRYELKRMPIKGTESMLRFRLRLALAAQARLGPDPSFQRSP